MSCVLFSNTAQLTKDQMDQLLHGAFQIIWEEAMEAKIAANQILTTTREELLDNLSENKNECQILVTDNNYDKDYIYDKNYIKNIGSNFKKISLDSFSIYIKRTIFFWKFIFYFMKN